MRLTCLCLARQISLSSTATAKLKCAAAQSCRPPLACHILLTCDCLAQVTGSNLWPIKTYLSQLGLKHKDGSYVAEEKFDDDSAIFLQLLAFVLLPSRLNARNFH